ncbi:MAG: hypothetical protein KME45_03275 [Stenomitos rutilans HA7619-LM2]|jgi:hypothetical protein|nr:hypothetical protein [Stenomitos rutilans HA7619-LM2]MBW4469406.1 hypothetical protein [Stenomitos rutilans HA7619-LM2]
MNTTTLSPVTQTEGTYYGLPSFKLDGEEYIVGTLAQATTAAAACIRECAISSGLIDAEMLLAYSCLPPQALALMRHLQGGCYTIAEEQALMQVLDVEALTEAALSRYGIARFLCAGYGDTAVGRTLSSFPAHVGEFILQALGLTAEQAATARLYRV